MRSVTRTESPWDEQERGWMLALAEWEATRCPACGGDPAECQGDGAYARWMAPAPRRCHKTTTVREAQAARAKKVPSGVDDHSDALLWRVTERGASGG